MSRFDENFDRDLTVIAERVTPSPTAWEEIQQRIADREPTTETEIIMLTDNTTRTRRWPLVAAAAAVAAIAVGAIALVNRDDGAEQPADPPEPVPTVAPAPEEVGDATALPGAGQALEPGRYVVDELGVTVEFDITATDWKVGLNNPLAFTIESDAGFWGMQRIGSFLDAEQAQNPDVPGLGTISPADVDGWIEANGMIVDASSETTVADRTAQFRQVRVPPSSGSELCPSDAQPCIRVNSVSADLIEANPGEGSRIGGEFANAYWFIELDDFEPIGIWAYAFDGDIDAWLDEIAPVVESIVLGEPAPAVEGGTARVSTFGAGAEVLVLPEAGSEVAAGRYASDAIGVPLQFEVQTAQNAPWSLVTDDPGGVQLISDGPVNEFIAIGRVGSWYDAAEARTEATTGLGSIAADDLDGWIAANGVIVVDSDDVEVGGRAAQYRLVRLDTTPGTTADFCPAGESPCLWAASSSADLIGASPTPTPVGRDRLHALWLVDMDEFEPAIVVAVSDLDDTDWFDEIVQPVVDSIVFGAPAPVIDGGTARVPERVAVTANMTVTETGERDIDAPWPVERTGSLDGDIVGTYTATGVSSPNGDEVALDWTMDATIDGFGTGTLTLHSVWVWLGDGAHTASDRVISGTGDFEGVTGFGTSTQTSDFGPGEEYTATIELMLAPPTG